MSRVLAEFENLLRDAERLKLLQQRLTEYADRLIKRKTWCGVLSGAPCDGKEAGDIVGEVLLGVIQQPDRFKEFAKDGTAYTVEQQLFGMVRNKVSNLVTSLRNRQSVRASTPAAPGSTTTIGDLLLDEESTPRALDEKALEEEKNQILLEFLDSIDEDKELMKLCEFALEGKRRAEAAAQLDIPLKEYDNRRGRLLRAYTKFRDQRKRSMVK